MANGSPEARHLAAKAATIVPTRLEVAAAGVPPALRRLLGIFARCASGFASRFHPLYQNTLCDHSVTPFSSARYAAVAANPG
jgi:hypothetical protein